MHLANNSIQKKSKQFRNSLIPGNMWHSDTFVEYIKDKTGSTDLWYNQIQPQLKNIVVWALQSAQDMVSAVAWVVAVGCCAVLRH